MRLQEGECIPFPGSPAGAPAPRTPAVAGAASVPTAAGPASALDSPPDSRGPLAAAAVRCVWTRPFDQGSSCEQQVPLAVMQAAWRHELGRAREHAGFFNFSWQNEVWLGYGLPDGQVRGVFCPAHRAEREQRLGYDPKLAV